MPPSNEDNAPESRPADPVKNYAMMAAAAAGGLLAATRWKPAGILLLAGSAAAAALLGRRRAKPTSPAVATPLQLTAERADSSTPPDSEPATTGITTSEAEPIAATVPPAVIEPIIPSISVEDSVQDWLARQIQRDQETHVIPLEELVTAPTDTPIPEPAPPAPPAPPPPPPPAPSAPPPPVEFFAPALTEEPAPKSPEITPAPIFAPVAPPAPPAEIAPKPSASLQSPFFSESAHAILHDDKEAAVSLLPQIDLKQLQALESTESDASTPPGGGVGAAWLLGLEPLPSWDESSLFSRHHDRPEPLIPMDQPPQSRELIEPAATHPAEIPTYIPPLFQGGNLPDLIQVPEAPIPPPAATEPIPFHTPAIQHSVEAFLPEVAPQLPPVELPPAPIPAPLSQPFSAQPLEIPAVSGTSAEPPPLPASPTPSPDQTIYPRPRGLTPSTIVPKQPLQVTAPAPVLPSSSLLEKPAESATTEAEQPPPVILPPAPIVVPREQKARKTWRSWWRGD